VWGRVGRGGVGFKWWVGMMNLGRGDGGGEMWELGIGREGGLQGRS